MLLPDYNRILFFSTSKGDKQTFQEINKIKVKNIN